MHFFFFSFFASKNNDSFLRKHSVFLCVNSFHNQLLSVNYVLGTLQETGTIETNRLDTIPTLRELSFFLFNWRIENSKLVVMMSTMKETHWTEELAVWDELADNLNN